MVAFLGYGGACPDYTVGDARFSNSFIGYGDDARIVNRLRVSCFCLAVTISETGFVTIAVTEFLHGLRYLNLYRDTVEIHFGRRKLAQLR